MTQDSDADENGKRRVGQQHRVPQMKQFLQRQDVCKTRQEPWYCEQFGMKVQALQLAEKLRVNVGKYLHECGKIF